MSTGAAPTLLRSEVLELIASVGLYATFSEVFDVFYASNISHVFVVSYVSNVLLILHISYIPYLLPISRVPCVLCLPRLLRQLRFPNFFRIALLRYLHFFSRSPHLPQLPSFYTFIAVCNVRANIGVPFACAILSSLSALIISRN